MRISFLKRRGEQGSVPHSKWILLSLVSGAMLTALTLVFPTVGFLEWITMIPLFLGVFWLCDAPKAGWLKCYGFGFLTVFAYYFIIYHWFLQLYPLDFVGLDNGASVAVVLVGWLGLSLLQALPGGLIFVFYRLISKSGVFERLPLAKPFVFSALWVIFEWFSTLTWTGVPWGRLCLGQIKLLPMLQLSSAFGSYAVSFLLLAVNGLLAYGLLYHRRRMACVITAASLLVGNLLFGLIWLGTDIPSTETLRAAVVQGNINSHDKWDSESDERTMEIYAELTAEAAKEGAELVVWPETAIPYILNEDDYFMDYVTDVAMENNVTLIVGALYDGEEGYFNSLYLVTPDGEISEERYDKRHLVPFGEYVPLRDLITALVPPLAELSALEDDLDAGADSNLFSTQWGEIGSMICFDSIYEALGRDSVRDGADLMVISSNDSWFRDSAAVYQHRAQGQIRAIEEGRYVLRSANTGISAVITPKGEMMSEIEPLVDGYAVCEVASIERNTLYMRIGNLFVYLCIAFCVGLPLLGLSLKTEIVAKMRRRFRKKDRL